MMAMYRYRVMQPRSLYITLTGVKAKPLLMTRVNKHLIDCCRMHRCSVRIEYAVQKKTNFN